MASFILLFRVRNRAGGGDDLRGGDIATENARLGATGPIDLLDTEDAIAVRDDLAAPNAQLLDRSVSLFKALGGGLAAAGEEPNHRSGNRPKPLCRGTRPRWGMLSTCKTTRSSPSPRAPGAPPSR
ncbi:MAG: hypothetical protein P4M09_21025 [Devosia sp.]|nr:hypothetical protein [Devosia sp.]